MCPQETQYRISEAMQALSDHYAHIARTFARFEDHMVKTAKKNPVGTFSFPMPPQWWKPPCVPPSPCYWEEGELARCLGDVSGKTVQMLSRLTVVLAEAEGRLTKADPKMEHTDRAPVTKAAKLGKQKDVRT